MNTILILAIAAIIILAFSGIFTPVFVDAREKIKLSKSTAVPILILISALIIIALTLAIPKL